MKKLMFIVMLTLGVGLVQGQTFGSDTPPNPSPGRPEGTLPGGGAGAPVAEGAVITMALAAGYALMRRKKENR